MTSITTVKEVETRVVTEQVAYVVSAGMQGPPGASGAAIDDAVPSLTTTFSGQHIMELISPFNITSFTVAPSTAEMGAVVTSVALNWASNYAPDTISLNNSIGPLTPTTSYTHSGQSITASRTYTLTAVKNGATKTASATLTFLNQWYYGVLPAQSADAASIKTLTHGLSGARARSLTFNCTGGRYFHIAYPARLGNATFQINGLTYSDVTKTIVSITNDAGFAENYNVYYCNIIQYGAAITLIVQ